jgi:hypothetical protein
VTSCRSTCPLVCHPSYPSKFGAASIFPSIRSSIGHYLHQNSSAAGDLNYSTHTLSNKCKV